MPSAASSLLRRSNVSELDCAHAEMAYLYCPHAAQEYKLPDLPTAGVEVSWKAHLSELANASCKAALSGTTSPAATPVSMT